MSQNGWYLVYTDLDATNQGAAKKEIELPLEARNESEAIKEAQLLWYKITTAAEVQKKDQHNHLNPENPQKMSQGNPCIIYKDCITLSDLFFVPGFNTQDDAMKCISKAIAFSEICHGAVSFHFSGVIIKVESDSNHKEIFRDYLLAHAGLIDKEIGPYPDCTPKLNKDMSAEEVDHINRAVNSASHMV